MSLPNHTSIIETISSFDETKIFTDFSEEVQKQTSDIIDNHRVSPSRVFEEGITIDGVESLDLDDAIWAEKTKQGYSVWIHIADPTESIEIYSPLDLEALKRSTSIYRSEGVIPMIPESLSNSLFSLNEDGEKNTLSMQVDLDDNGDILKYHIYESRFKNLKRHNYEDFIDTYINPEDPNHTTYQIMHEIARKRRRIRKLRGARLDFSDSNRQMHIGEKRIKPYNKNKKIPSRIVEEFAILFNQCGSEFMLQSGNNMIFRNQEGIGKNAYYSNINNGHYTLGLNSCSHTTSPIRRYPDMIAHRIIKSIINNQGNIYSKGIIEGKTNYINKRDITLKILGSTYDLELWGAQKISLMQKIHGEELKTNHFKEYLRRNIALDVRIPENIKKQIAYDILFSSSMSDWAFSIPIILLSREDDLKKILREKVLSKEYGSYTKFLSTMTEHRKLKGEKSDVFQVEETHKDNIFTITFYHYQKPIIQRQGRIIGKNKKGEIRREMVQAIFDFFM